MMNSRTIMLLLPLSLCLVLSCGTNMEGEQAIKNYVATADSVAVTEGGDLSDLNSDARKVVYKADMRCRVADVERTVARLEKFVTAAGGFIQESHTTNNVVNEKTASYGADSLKTVQQYSTDADLVIRIPNFALDTLLREISSVSDFTNFRHLTRDDVTLQFLSNMLKNRAVDEATPVTKQEMKNTKDPVALRQQQQNVAVNKVDRQIANLGMQDDSRYASLALNLYQPEQAVVFVKQDTDGLLAAGFGERVGNALRFSIDIIKEGILLVISLWPVWLAAVLLILYFRRLGRKKAQIAA